LNDEQLAMFQFISKDFCSVNDLVNQTEIARLRNLQSDKENLVKIIINYKDKLEKSIENISFIDKKLFNMLDNDLKINLNK
jgi:hypothetical protein